MNVTLLIDAIVRQTTVLIAQLATGAGIRAPLSHMANEVFLGLVRELKEQGLGNKVIADMFGLALSTYHSKMRRLSESRSERGRSLWEATLAFVRESETVHQADVLRRFRYDDEPTVRGVLNDLVESGLVFRTGRGDSTAYRAARPEELSLTDIQNARDGSVNLVWLAVHRSGPATLEEIESLVPLEREALCAALEQLVGEQRVMRIQSNDTVRYSADECVVPFGESGGWEAAVFDHYQALVTALCTKVRMGRTRASVDDTVGGSTYGFTVWPDHPHYDEVLGFLGKMRGDAVALRTKVRAYNAAHETPASSSVGVIAYFGQVVMEREQEETA